MRSYRDLKKAIRSTGVMDSTYQRKRFDADKSNSLSNIVLCMLLFTMLSIAEFFIIDHALSVLKLRVIFAPTIVLLLVLLLVGTTPRLFYILTMLVFGLSGIYFMAYVYDGEDITLMYCTAVIAMTLFVMMPVLKVPIHFSALPSLAMVVFFCLSISDQPYIQWLTCASAISSLWLSFAFSETVRSIDEYQLFNENRRLHTQSLALIRWSYMTGRLLRHELANQLIGLSSSLEMLQRNANKHDQVRINKGRQTVTSILEEVNELALAGEWSAHEGSLETSTDVLDVTISTFANHNILIYAESFDKNLLTVRASKNVIIYATNHIAKLISSVFSTRPVCCEASRSQSQAVQLELSFSSIAPLTDSSPDMAALSSHINGTAMMHAMTSLLMSQGIKASITEKNNRLTLYLEKIAET
jgi:hypothetical protein